MAITSPSRVRRDAIDTLTRRRDYLAGLLADYKGHDPSRSRAEVRALNYVLRIVDAAYREGVLDDLERATGLRLT